jgi:hypothetical protein
MWLKRIVAMRASIDRSIGTPYLVALIAEKGGGATGAEPPTNSIALLIPETT